jgi:hypothetical protein
MKTTHLLLTASLALTAAAARAETIRIANDHVVATYSCANEDVSVTGNSNTITFTGMCRNVKISGSNNHVVMVQAQTVALAGHGNIVSWKSGSPKVTDAGGDNHADVEIHDTAHPTQSNARTDASQQTPGTGPPKP